MFHRASLAGNERGGARSARTLWRVAHPLGLGFSKGAVFRFSSSYARFLWRAGGRALIPKNAFGWPTLSGLVYERAGGRALIPKNAFGWPTLSGLVYERVGSFSSPFPDFHFPISIFYRRLSYTSHSQPANRSPRASFLNLPALPARISTLAVRGRKVIPAGFRGETAKRFRP
jgi:hypothetical protein